VTVSIFIEASDGNKYVVGYLAPATMLRELECCEVVFEHDYNSFALVPSQSVPNLKIRPDDGDLGKRVIECPTAHDIGILVFRKYFYDVPLTFTVAPTTGECAAPSGKAPEKTAAPAKAPAEKAQEPKKRGKKAKEAELVLEPEEELEQEVETGLVEEPELEQEPDADLQADIDAEFGTEEPSAEVEEEGEGYTMDDIKKMTDDQIREVLVNSEVPIPKSYKTRDDLLKLCAKAIAG